MKATKALELMEKAEELGWTLDHVTGSHHIYKKEGRRSVSIPGREIARFPRARPRPSPNNWRHGDLFESTYVYPAHFAADEDGTGWNVRIPGLDGSEEGAFTCGDDLEDARRMASGLLEAWLVTHLREGTRIPRPSALPKGEGWEWVRLKNFRTDLALSIRARRARLGLSQSEVAERLGMKQPSYAKLEDLRKSNPTLATLEKVHRVLGGA